MCGRGPPILTIQGSADTIVPYSHGKRPDEAVKRAGGAHELVTIPGGKHGGFTPAEHSRIYAKIREFLGRNGLPNGK